MRLAFSVDLEPNQDGSVDDVRDAMAWFDDHVDRGTVFSTYRIAEDLPDLLADLATTHEIGVHVHPREFGHEHDQFARLPGERQRDLLAESRSAVASAAGCPESDVTSFRAGRHSMDQDGLDALADLGFTVDASVNVRYEEHLPREYTQRARPFELPSGLLEVPTTFVRPSVLSRVGLSVYPNRSVTATAASLRSDSRLCSGLHALSYLFERADDPISMYMHPYDATDYHEMHNCGEEFRRRAERLFERVTEFVRIETLDPAGGYDGRD